jgi:hypothetical protein
MTTIQSSDNAKMDRTFAQFMFFKTESLGAFPAPDRFAQGAG